MGGYQYYEFQALDHPLSREDQDYVQSLSSRVELTDTRAEFVYHYGDFRGDPVAVLDRCFDIMVYVYSYGVRQLMIRFPKSLVDTTLWEPYCIESFIEIIPTEKSVILNLFAAGEQYADWLSEQQYVRDLIALRDDLMKGDLRVLYLAWLAVSLTDQVPDEPEIAIEPPVPANLKKLSKPLNAFADLFEIDPDLITAAADVSDAVQEPAEPIADWIAALPESERNAYLLRVVQGETHVGAELMLRLRQEFGQSITRVNTATRRTLAQLLDLAEAKEAIREQKEQRAAELKQQAAEKARQKRLTEISPQAEALWEEVIRLIELKQTKAYDEAVAHLVDLRDIAEQQGQIVDFRHRVGALKQKYSSRSAFVSRLRDAKLIK